MASGGNGSEEPLLLLISAGVGAAATALGQLLTERSAKRRHRAELRQRERELWTSFVLPAAQARIQAFAKVYDLLQRVIEEGRLTPTDYSHTRELFFYFPDEMRPQLISALTAMLRATPGTEESREAIHALRALQRDLRMNTGLIAIETHVSRLTEGDDSE